MNPNTGELRALVTKLDMQQAKQDGFEVLPEHLNRAARIKLNGRKSAKVSLTSGGALSKHARYLRKKKRAAEKSKRRANRHN